MVLMVQRRLELKKTVGAPLNLDVGWLQEVYAND